jgi:hypothetical protein
MHVALPEYSVRFSALKVHATNFLYDFYDEYHPFDVFSSPLIFQFYVLKKKTFIAVLWRCVLDAEFVLGEHKNSIIDVTARHSDQAVTVCS